MTIEIRELVIQAKVYSDEEQIDNFSASHINKPVSIASIYENETALVERITKRVMEKLREEREYR